MVNRQVTKTESSATQQPADEPGFGTTLPRLHRPGGKLQATPYLSSLDPGLDVSLESLLKICPEDSGDLISRAHEFADRLHRGQSRKSGRPYIHHPLMVAHYLAEMNMDAPSIAAGLLHDVLEDTETTPDRLLELFPESVVEIVRGVTKISKMNFRTTREAQVENLRIMILAMARDIRVVIVKLADRLHNMKTLEPLPPERRIAISQETLDIYAPLANRLGIAAVKSDMEDLAMRWLFPDEYRALSKQVAKKRRDRHSMVEHAIETLYEYLQPHYPKIVITGRPKHFYSIHRKMVEQHLTFEQIYDLNALRIICSEESQCYEILGHIHSIWPPVPGRFKDYIGMPKKNMYQSIHTTVIGIEGAVTEIQIRTQEMHEVAEYGIAAHWHYKESGERMQNDDRLAWLRQLTEWITDPNEPEGFLEALRKDVFADRVLCFTPRGDVIELPSDAIPIDFAYAIHTKVGEQCVGARINGRMVNLRTPLNNGDVVEIITSKSGHPSRDWLDYVVTGRARQKIKHWLKARNIDEWVEQGRRSLARLLQDRGHSPSTQELDKELEGVLSAYKMQSVNDLLVEIGFGQISAHAVLARAKPEWVMKKTKTKKTAPKQKPKKRTGAISIQGMEDTPARVANCCLPIPGDKIVGFVTRGRGVTVHRTDCPNVIRAQKNNEERDRLLPASWEGDGTASYAATVHVQCEDRSGLLSDITGVISGNGAFIKECHTRSDMHRNKAVLVFNLNVANAQQLRKVLADLEKQRGVIEATRKHRGRRNGG